MRFSFRRLLVALVAPVVIGALTTCTENNVTSRPPSPVTRWAGLAFTPAFSASSKQAAAIYRAAGLEFDRVRVVITRPPSEMLKDTTVNFTVGQSDLVLNLEVPAAPGEELTAVLEYRAGNVVLFAGSATLTAQALTATTTAPPSVITVTPVGPGATAASVVVSPSSGSFPATGPVAFTARALTASGTDIAGALFVWSVDNAAVGTIDATTGVVTPAAQGGALRVRATTLNGTFGDASVTFVSPPARILTISGGGQTAVVGAALSQAFVVEVQSASGTPVPNQTVVFGAAGGASVSPGSATTGANGRAQTTMTLGRALGNYSFAASVSTFSTSVSAVATVGPPASIAAVSGGGQADTVKKALQNPFVVKVTDQFGNPTPNVTVTWNRTTGTGSLSASTSTTNADGLTNVSYTLGTKVGSESVSASVGGVTTVATFTVQALPTGPAAIAVVSGSGQTGRASQPLATPFVVTVTDDVGNPVGGTAVNWTATNGTIPPTTTTDAAGISSNTLTLGSTVGPATATATVGAGPTAKSVSFTVAVQPGVVARVAFRTQPTNGATGVALKPAIQVELLDGAGNLTAATNTVSIALGSNPGSATLGGTLTRAAVAGVATFDDVTLSAGGTGYTMVASSAGVPSVTSGAFDISFAAPVALQFLTQPTNVVVGAAISPAVQVRLVNAQGATVTTATNSVSIAIGANPSEGTLGGTLTVAAVNGVATFSNLTINNAANGYALQASSPNLTTATSVAFNVTSVAPPPAVGVAFQVAPSNVTVATVMAPAVTVRAIDAQGATVTGFTGNVTIAIGTNPANGALGGTLTRAAVAGVATFNDLTVSAVGNGYTLIASSTNLTPATSAAFNVTSVAPPPAVGVAFQVAPSNVTVGATMVPAVTVRAIDAQGATVPGFTGSVTIAIGTNPGSGILGGTLTRAAIAGVATFNDLTVSAAGNGYTLVASSPGLTGATTFGFNVTAAPAVAVAVQFLVQPTNVATGNTIAPAVQVRLVDAQGATVTTATNTVAIAIGTNPGSGTLSGTLSAAAVNGIATFANLSINNVGNGYTLAASSTGLTPATSTAFNVIAASQSIIAWSNAAGGLWSVPTNWNLGRVPVTSDSVIVALAGTYTVTLDVDFTATYITVGALSGTQTLAMISRTLTVNNTLTVKATGVFAPSGTSVVTGVGTTNNLGVLRANGAVTLNGLITTVPGSLIRVEGNNGNAALAVGSAGGLTNNGAIELTSVGAGFSSQLTVVNGSLTNTSSGTITSVVGATGQRTITAQLVNQGLLTVNQPLTLNAANAAHTNTGTIDASSADLTVSQTGTSPSITTSGTVTIGVGRTVSVTGGTLNLSGGTLAGTGTLSLSSVTANLGIDVTNAVTALSLTSSTINGPGTITNATGKTLTIANTTIAATSGLTNLGTIVTRGSSAINGSLTTAPTSLVRVEGNNGNAALTVGTAGGMTNNGAIELTSVGAGFSSQLTVTNGSLTNPSGSTITSVVGAGGPRTLTAQLLNQGLLTVNQPLTLNANNAAHTNSGTIDVSGADLSVNQSGAPASITTSGTVTIGAGRTLSLVGGTLNLTGGTLAGAGTLNLSSVTANLGIDVTNAVTTLTASSSTFNGPGTITNASGKTLTILSTTIAATSALTNQGTIVTRGSSAINGPVTTAPASLLRVEGNNGNAALTVGSAGGMTNNGAIELTSFGAGFSSQLTVSNGPLTNASGGTITSVPGAAGARTLTAQLINQGLLTVNQPLTLNAINVAHTNSGTIDASGADLTLNQSGASASITTTGTVTIGAGRTLFLTGGVLNLTGGTLAGTGTLNLSSATANLGVNITNAVTTFVVSTSTINGPGTITNAPGKTLTIQSTTIAATSALTNLGTIVSRGSSEIDGPVTTAPGSLVRVEGNNGNAALTVGSVGGMTNNGAIELTSFGAGFSSQLTVSNGPLTNANGGTITSVPGAAGARTLTAQLNNQGLLTVNQPLTLNAVNVAHVNSGTIDVSGGDLTVTQSGAAASVTTSGTMTVGTGRTLFLTGGTLNLAATGVLAGSGVLNLSSVTANLGADITNAVTALVVSNSTINGPGRIINAAGKTLTMLGTTIAATSGLSNQGTVVVRGTSEIDGPVTTAVASLVRVEGNNGNAILTVATAGGMTNTGAIELTSVGAGFASQLTVNNGPLTNASGGTITALPGAAGPRTLTAQLNNQGALTVNQPLTLNAVNAAHTNSGTIDVTAGDLTVTQSGGGASITTSGTVTIGAGRILSLTGGTLNLSSTGTFTGLGTLNLSSVTANLGADITNAVTTLVVNNSTINGPGTIVNAAGKTLTLSGTTIAATSGLNNQGTVVARQSSEIDGSLTTAAGSLVRVEGSNGNAVLTVGTAGGFTNNGAIEIISVGSSFSSALTVTNGPLTNASGGTITTLPGAAGPRTITAQLNNQGALTINQALTINGVNAAHTNAGTLNVNANLTVTQSGGAPSFTNSGTAAIAAGQTWLISGGTFTQQAGATLNGGGAMSLSSTTAAFNTGFTLGALTLTSTTATFQNNLSTAALALNFISSTINGPGTITNPAGQTMTIQGSTIGATSGLTNQGIVVASGSSAINGLLTTGTGSTLRLEGNSNVGNSALTVGGATGFTNNGAIEMTATGSSFSSQLTVTNGTLTNAAGGTITSIVGAGGPRTITAQLDNQGVMTVNEPLTLNAANAAHTNSGTMSVVGPTLNITQTGASASFTNTGTVAIGAAGTLTVTGGAFTQQTGATLNGGGTLALTSVTSAAFKTTFTLGALKLTGTTANIQNDLSTTGLSLQLSSSTLNGPGIIANAPGQTLSLQSSTIGTTSGLTNQGIVVASGSSAINGSLTNVAGSTLRTEGNSNAGNSILTVGAATGLTNNGAIELTTTGSSFVSQLTVTNGTLTNATAGTITSLVGAGGPRTLTAQLDNQGLITVNQPLTINGVNAGHTNSGSINVNAGDLTLTQTGANPSFSNSGAVTIANGRTWSINGGTFTHQAGASLNGVGAMALSGVSSAAFNTGFTIASLALTNTTATIQTNLSTATTSLSLISSTINGPGTITNAAGKTTTLQTSTIGASSGLTNQGTLLATGISAINGLLTTASGSVLRMQGNSIVGNSSLTVGGANLTGFTNNGLIDLTTTGSSFASSLTVSNGVLLNASGGGTITSSLGNGGPRTITAAVNNQGIMTVASGATQLLTITGSLVTSGTINLEIGGLTAGTQYDRIAISGGATLGGTLNVALVNGFGPVAGNTFDVLTFGSVTGDFGTYVLPSGGWTHAQQPTLLRLTAP